MGNGVRNGVSFQGQIASVHDGSANLLRTEFYGAGRHVATLPGSNLSFSNMVFNHSDWLGTERVRTNASGTAIEWCTDTPYGMNMNCATNQQSDTSPMHFTGKQRDYESGLDNFGARYFGGGNDLGRWMSPDSINLTDARVLNPANTLNKYVYGGNNPLKYLDPDGRDITVFYDNGLPAGHFMMLAYNQDTGDFAVKSFGPANGHDAGTMAQEVIGLSVPGREMYGLGDLKSADDLRNNYSSLTIQTSPEVAQQAINEIRSNPSGDYNVYTNNCSSTCAKVLADIKLIQSSLRSGTWGMRPVALWNLLYSRYGNHGSDWNSETTQAPEDRGRDYGQPRYPMNTFDFMWLLQRQPKGCVTTWGPDGNGGSKPTKTCG